VSRQKQADYAPVSVVEYNKDVVVDFIRFITGWNERAEISDKPQLEYILKYLAVDQIAAKTAVIESEYIDRHYLEDYSEYYARCFSEHPRQCSRIHFFSHGFDITEFISAIKGENSRLIDKLEDSYIGFIVIRPLPHTFLARVCFIPYPELKNNHRKYTILTSPQSVSLFGISLKVETSAFLEQDKVVSACATSALWSLLSATGHINRETLPSPSSITKMATVSPGTDARTFPTKGLNPADLMSVIQAQNMEPTRFPYLNIEEQLSHLKSVAFSYLSNGIPFLLGGYLYELQTDEASGKERFVLLGKHFVCVLGYALGEEVGAHITDAPNFLSSRLATLYVHDDRVGPFAKMSLELKNFEGTEQYEDDKNLVGLELGLLDREAKVKFIPDTAIVGTNHKIRLSHEDVNATVLAFFQAINIVLKQVWFGENPPSGISPEKVDSGRQCLDGICEGTWAIKLSDNSSLKSKVLRDVKLISYNGDINKESFLLTSLPKHLWLLSISTTEGDLITEVIFDATEVAQSTLLIGYLCYTPEAHEFWMHLGNAIDKKVFHSLKVPQFIRINFGGILKYFTGKSRLKGLTELFGPSSIPDRGLKPGEEDSSHNIKPRGDVKTLHSQEKSDWTFLDQAKDYIWVIDDSGAITFGEDLERSGNRDSFAGHPTLIDGGPARLGGELKRHDSKNSWVINLKSGAYSHHFDPFGQQAKQYLNNVITHRLFGLNVEVEGDES